jgi:transposase InsO family protein
MTVTYRKMKQFVAWKGMKLAVQEFAQNCVTCQQAKPDRSKAPGLLQPLFVPDAAWQHISMDFVDGLPQSGSVNCIMVIVDRFTKYNHFLSLRHPYIAYSVAKLFLNQVYKLHGLPLSIVTNRDQIFTSNLWSALFELAGVQFNMGLAYHPQSDGQTERVNQCMETFLRCFVTACPRKWVDWLPLAEFWYNTSYHSTISQSPF